MEVEIIGSILNNTFIKLITAIENARLKVVIGGGYGLFLKSELVIQHDLPTILPKFNVGTRSTDDIDMFLDIEVIAEPDQTMMMKQVLDDMGFIVIEGAEYYQFLKSDDVDSKVNSVKIDLQTGPVPDEMKTQVRIRDDRRIRPKKKGMYLHAHSSPEALGIRDSMFSFNVICMCENGNSITSIVNLPQPFTYVMMKTKSFYDKMQRDGLRDDLDIPGKHAWDVFRILALTTEEELEASKKLSESYKSNAIYIEVANIVNEYFGTIESPGTLRALTYGRRLGINLNQSDTKGILTLLAELLQK